MLFCCIRCFPRAFRSCLSNAYITAHEGKLQGMPAKKKHAPIDSAPYHTSSVLSERNLKKKGISGTVFATAFWLDLFERGTTYVAKQADAAHRFRAVLAKVLA